jgi:hypothetical protein
LSVEYGLLLVFPIAVKSFWVARQTLTNNNALDAVDSFSFHRSIAVIATANEQKEKQACHKNMTDASTPL